jgi:hypothetical protein
VTWRSNRPYMVPHSLSWGPREGSAAGALAAADEGELVISGYLRGRPLNVHQLVCVPGVGTFQQVGNAGDIAAVTGLPVCLS